MACVVIKCANCSVGEHNKCGGDYCECWCRRGANVGGSKDSRS